MAQERLSCGFGIAMPRVEEKIGMNLQEIVGDMLEASRE